MEEYEVLYSWPSDVSLINMKIEILLTFYFNNLVINDIESRRFTTQSWHHYFCY